MLRSAWMLLAAALPLVSLQTSCSQTSPQEISDAGTLRLRLTGQSSAGHTYRLRDAELEITGPTDVTLHSEDDPDAESLRRELPAGEYEILLEDGWFLERENDDGEFVPVEAVLMSANPAPFEIVAEETTQVQLRFEAGDEIVDLGDGTLEVSIASRRRTSAFRGNGNKSRRFRPHPRDRFLPSPSSASTPTLIRSWLPRRIRTRTAGGVRPRPSGASTWITTRDRPPM